MVTITHPDPTAIQLSASDENGRPILSVVCKRTYEIRPNGQLALAAQQVPLVQDFEPDPENPHRLHHDTDLYPVKLLTDIVVHGHAYGTGQRAFIATVQIGAFKKEVAVFGDRHCTLGKTGNIIFSEPKVIERIPLRYDRAYGGIDAVAQETHGNPVEALGKYLDPSIDISGASPYTYPRNHVGVGYLIEPTSAAVERLMLPNLEDPLDRLSPTRLAVGDPMRWPLMPVPHAFDWVDPGTFPRLAYMGIVHDHEPPKGLVAEVARGWVSADILDEKPVEEKANLRFTNGASLGLQVPYLQGGEQCMLGGLHPRLAVLKFQLSKERPEIKTDGRNGTMKSTKPVMHTVEIEPDDMRVSIVWRGSAPALRPYMTDELAKMPLFVNWS